MFSAISKGVSPTTSCAAESLEYIISETQNGVYFVITYISYWTEVRERMYYELSSTQPGFHFGYIVEDPFFWKMARFIYIVARVCLSNKCL